MAFNVMGNKVAGSEGPFAHLCQARYPDHQGWSNQPNLSQCTANAIPMLADYDLILLQEVNPSYWPVLIAELLNRTSEKGRQYSTIYDPTVLLAIVYDRDVFGLGNVVSPPTCLWGDCDRKVSDRRGLLAVHFPDRKLLVADLHAPHGIQLKPSLERAFQELREFISIFGNGQFVDRDIERMIVGGDFNDYRGQLLIPGTMISAFDKHLSVPTMISPPTCCYDTNYQYPGDYILDSQGSDGVIYYGRSRNYDRQLTPMSDHDPIVLTIRL